MKKISLPVDLITINTNLVDEGVKALEFSSRKINFNNVFLVSNEEVKGNFDLIKIKKFRNIEEYNKTILSINKFIKSDFALIIQHDGYVINPYKWDDSFLNYDYIGAPWPNNKKWNKRWDAYQEGNIIKKNLNYNRVGNGGFSLRSKKFIEYSSKFDSLNLPEDIFLNVFQYDEAIKNKIIYPNINTAMKFSYETPLVGKSREKDFRYMLYNKKKHFGWHGDKFLNSKKLINLKNN